MTGTTHTATLYDPATGLPVAVVESVRLAADTGWAPRWQGTVDIIADRDQVLALPEVLGVRLRRISGQGFTLADWTARYGGAVAALPGTLAEITAELGGTPDADPPEQLDVQLMLREAPRHPLLGRATLTLTSPEMRLQDVRRMMPEAYTSTHTSLTQLVLYVLAQVDPDIQVITPATDHVILIGTVWEPGMTAWEVLAPHLTAAGWSLYADTPTRYRLGTRSLADTVTLTLGPDELTEAELARDPRRAVTTRMTKTTDPKSGGVKIDGIGPQGILPGDYDEYQRTLPAGNYIGWTISNAGTRVGSRESVATVTAAAHYTPRPDDRAQLDLTPAGVGHIGQIAWSYPDGLMTLTLENYDESEA